MDDDADENRLLRYTIISVSPDAPTMGIGGFEIDVNTGTVRTTGSFDREVFGGLYSIAVSFKLLNPLSFLPPSFSPLHLSLPHSFPPFLPPSLLSSSHPPSLLPLSSLPPSLPPQILVQDSGVPRRNGSTRLIVYLTDINDNNPVFSPGNTSCLSTKAYRH